MGKAWTVIFAGLMTSVPFFGEALLPMQDVFRYEMRSEKTETDWIDYYNELIRPEKFNSVSDTNVSYSDGEDGQVAVLKDLGQGFFGSYTADLDLDGDLELFAIGSWYQGPSKECIDMEAYVYDEIDGIVQGTKVFSWSYAGDKELVSALEEATLLVNVQNRSEELPYMIFRGGGKSEDSQQEYYSIDVITYSGSADGIDVIVSESSLNREDSWETSASEIDNVLYEIGVEDAVQPGEEEIAVGNIRLENHYENGWLQSGYVRYTDGESSLTAEEVYQAMRDVGFETITVSEWNGKFEVIIYYYTFADTVMMVDPVTGIGEMYTYDDADYSNCLGTINLRTKTVLSGNPLPYVPTSEAAVYTEPLSRDEVELKLKEYDEGWFSSYQYYSETDDMFVYRDELLGWWIEVYRYSGQVIEHNYRGLIMMDFNI